MATLNKTFELMDALYNLYDGNKDNVIGYLQGMIYLHIDDKIVDNHLHDINIDQEAKGATKQ